MELTLYLVGTDESNALEGMPFDSAESAQSFADDQGDPNVKVFSVTAHIDPSTIEVVK